MRGASRFLMLTAALCAVTASVALGATPPPQGRSVPPMRSTPSSQVATLPAEISAALASVHATNTGYDLDFTLPTAAKAGCSVCHGDPALVRLQPDGDVRSFFVDPVIVDASAHAGTACTGCHTAFASSTPHKKTGDWRSDAKSVCRNCHQQPLVEYSRGVHGPQTGRPATATASAATTAGPQGSAATTDAPKPLCGDCHGDHGMPVLTDNPTGARQVAAAGYDVCGKCHQDYWDNYDDYYHGAAYKEGNLDAPACWDCHGYHEILPSDDPASSVGKRYLADTCGECHPGEGEGYLAYAEFIHGRKDIRAENPLYALFDSMIATVRGVLDR